MPTHHTARKFRYPENRSDPFFFEYLDTLFAYGANTLTPSAMALCAYIVRRENYFCHTQPVNLTNEALCGVLGIYPQALRSARSAAVEAGWLAYRKGRKGRAGSYYATVPKGLGKGVTFRMNITRNRVPHTRKKKQEKDGAALPPNGRDAHAYSPY